MCNLCLLRNILTKFPGVTTVAVGSGWPHLFYSVLCLSTVIGCMCFLVFLLSDFLMGCFHLHLEFSMLTILSSSSSMIHSSRSTFCLLPYRSRFHCQTMKCGYSLVETELFVDLGGQWPPPRFSNFFFSIYIIYYF